MEGYKEEEKTGLGTVKAVEGRRDSARTLLSRQHTLLATVRKTGGGEHLLRPSNSRTGFRELLELREWSIERNCKVYSTP